VRFRIPVWLLEQARRSGTSEAELSQVYPALRAQDSANARNYVRAHPEEVDRQINENTVITLHTGRVDLFCGFPDIHWSRFGAQIRVFRFEGRQPGVCALSADLPAHQYNNWGAKCRCQWPFTANGGDYFCDPSGISPHTGQSVTDHGAKKTLSRIEKASL